MARKKKTKQMQTLKQSIITIKSSDFRFVRKVFVSLEMLTIDWSNLLINGCSCNKKNYLIDRRNSLASWTNTFRESLGYFKQSYSCSLQQKYFWALRYIGLRNIVSNCNYFFAQFTKITKQQITWTFTHFLLFFGVFFCRETEFEEIVNIL